MRTCTCGIQTEISIDAGYKGRWKSGYELDIGLSDSSDAESWESTSVASAPAPLFERAEWDRDGDEENGRACEYGEEGVGQYEREFWKKWGSEAVGVKRRLGRGWEWYCYLWDIWGDNDKGRRGDGYERIRGEGEGPTIGEYEVPEAEEQTRVAEEEALRREEGGGEPEVPSERTPLLGGKAPITRYTTALEVPTSNGSSSNANENVNGHSTVSEPRTRTRTSRIRRWIFRQISSRTRNGMLIFLSSNSILLAPLVPLALLDLYSSAIIPPSIPSAIRPAVYLLSILPLLHLFLLAGEELCAGVSSKYGFLWNHLFNGISVAVMSYLFSRFAVIKGEEGLLWTILLGMVVFKLFLAGVSLLLSRKSSSITANKARLKGKNMFAWELLPVLLIGAIILPLMIIGQKRFPELRIQPVPHVLPLPAMCLGLWFTLMARRPRVLFAPPRAYPGIRMRRLGISPYTSLALILATAPLILLLTAAFLSMLDTLPSMVAPGRPTKMFIFLPAALSVFTAKDELLFTLKGQPQQAMPLVTYSATWMLCFTLPLVSISAGFPGWAWEKVVILFGGVGGSLILFTFAVVWGKGLAGRALGLLIMAGYVLIGWYTLGM